MLFTAPIFIFVFLPMFLTIYYLAPNVLSMKNGIALFASVVFFSWGEPVFVFALLAGTFIDYKISVVISPKGKSSSSAKRFLLAVAICINVAMLILSKYLDFFVSDVVNPLGQFFKIEIDPPGIPLLLGISFITFHRVSYLVDSYKGRAVPPRGFFDCALYIFIFPQLIAGPIIRYHDIGYQIHDRVHTVEGFLTGFFRFSVGLTKKLIVADPLGIVADKIFGFSTSDLSTGYAWGGIVAYSLQIYFDFSGYSDMAIGLGRMMGFRFPENFNRPYIAQSVTEFWRRWHISLSNWMRLYLYIPLGGNRVSPFRTYVNLWVVFLTSGVWHGASWNFVVWGAYYGFFLSLERFMSTTALARIPVPSLFRQAITLLIVMVGWVFFRAPSLEYAVEYLSAMFMFSHENSLVPVPWGLIFGNRDLATMTLGSLIACAPFASPRFWGALRGAWSADMTVSGLREMSLQFFATAMLMLLAAGAIVSSEYVPFLYFRF